MRIFLVVYILFGAVQFNAQNEHTTTLKSRADSVIDFYKKSEFTKSILPAIAKFHTSVDTQTGLRIIDSLVSKPQGDMFWTYQMLALYLYCENELPVRYRERVEKTIRNYHMLRGDTDNHWLLYYTSIYLGSLKWTGLDGSKWFNGKTSDENYSEAKEWINYWMDKTIKNGMCEYDSPVYGNFYILPLLMLHQFSHDSIMKQNAETMLNFVFVDFATEYVDGMNGGANSRIPDPYVFKKKFSHMSTLLHFYIGDKPLFKNSKEFHANAYLIIAALSDYKMPVLISKLFTEKQKPDEVIEQKHSALKIRHYDTAFVPVYKYSYTTSDYCLGSIANYESGIQLQPWNLIWKTNNDSTVSTIFGLHPYYSDKECAAMFAGFGNTAVEEVISSKKTYDKEDKWIGSSPYERLFQNKDELIGLYDFTYDDAVCKHFDVFIPMHLKQKQINNTLFLEDENIIVAIQCFTEYSLTKEQLGYRLRSSGNKTGFVLRCVSKKEIKTIKQFEKNGSISSYDFNASSGDLQVKSKNEKTRTYNFSFKNETDQYSNILFKSNSVNSVKGSGIVNIKTDNEELELRIR